MIQPGLPVSDAQMGIPIKNVQKTNKKSWQLEEDTKLLQLVKEWGTTGYWKEISSRIDNRTSKQCRERYFHHLSPDLKKTGWTKEEDAIIIEMREKLGNHWTKIAEFLPGRTDSGIKNRWHLINRCKPSEAAGKSSPINGSGNTPTFTHAPPYLSKYYTDQDLLCLLHSHAEHTHIVQPIDDRCIVNGIEGIKIEDDETWIDKLEEICEMGSSAGNSLVANDLRILPQVSAISNTQQGSLISAVTDPSHPGGHSDRLTLQQASNKSDMQASTTSDLSRSDKTPYHNLGDLQGTYLSDKLKPDTPQDIFRELGYKKRNPNVDTLDASIKEELVRSIEAQTAANDANSSHPRPDTPLSPRHFKMRRFFTRENSLASVLSRTNSQTSDRPKLNRDNSGSSGRTNGSNGREPMTLSRANSKEFERKTSNLSSNLSFGPFAPLSRNSSLSLSKNNSLMLEKESSVTSSSFGLMKDNSILSIRSNITSSSDEAAEGNGTARRNGSFMTATNKGVKTVMNIFNYKSGKDKTQPES